MFFPQQYTLSINKPQQCIVAIKIRRWIIQLAPEPAPAPAAFSHPPFLDQTHLGTRHVVVVVEDLSEADVQHQTFLSCCSTEIDMGEILMIFGPM